MRWGLIISDISDTVSSACLTSHARTFIGINTFHFSGSVCAENVAFSNAAAGGCSSLNTPGLTRRERGELVEGLDVKEEMLCVVAVANDERGVISPCGRCRQFMFDYYPDIRVIVKTGVGEELGTVGIDELLPYAYVSGLRKKIVAVVE
jgi:cytidine deaminase